MAKTICEKCKKEIDNRGIKTHYNSCNSNIISKKKIDESLKQENGLYKCNFCFKEFKKKGINAHIWKNHGNGINHKPIIPGSGHLTWNKGLTKETDKRLMKSSETLSNNYKNGKIIPSNLGKKTSLETKNKISKSRTKWLENNPDKVPYLINHSSKESYPEKCFREKLEENKITGWIQEYRNGIYRYDFAFLDLKLDVEIDGATHETEKVKIIDKKRDEWSKEQGWKVIRFTAKEIKNNLNNCIKIINTIVTQ